MEPSVTTLRLNQAGFIYGESAPRGGLNVIKRLCILNRLQAFGGLTAVDLGCGKGSYALEIAKCYNSIIAIDILRENLAIARERLGSEGFNHIHFCCATADRLPIATESVDAVFMIEVLDHVPTMRPCLIEILRILRPGGMLYLTVPNRLFPLETHPVWFFGAHRNPLWFPFLPWFRRLHDRLATARVFSKPTIRDLGESVGLKLVKTAIAFPPLENRGGPGLRFLMTWFESTFLRNFGSILAAVFFKPAKDSGTTAFSSTENN